MLHTNTIHTIPARSSVRIINYRRTHKTQHTCNDGVCVCVCAVYAYGVSIVTTIIISYMICDLCAKQTTTSDYFCLEYYTNNNNNCDCKSSRTVMNNKAIDVMECSAHTHTTPHSHYNHINNGGLSGRKTERTGERERERQKSCRSIQIHRVYKR